MDGGGREKDKREDGVLSEFVGLSGIQFAAEGQKSKDRQVWNGSKFCFLCPFAPLRQKTSVEYLFPLCRS
jgi:hypothetical protein